MFSLFVLFLIGWNFFVKIPYNGGAKKSCQALLQGALEYLSVYQDCLDVRVSPQKQTVAVVWTPPSPNRYKINVDGAVFKEQKMAGVGILIRDAEG